MPDFQVPNRTYSATGNISPCVLVSISGSFEVAQSASGDTKLAGVSTSFIRSGLDTLAAESGDPIGVFGPGQECDLTLGTGGATAGDHLSPDANGNGITAAPGSGKTTGAIALETGTVNAQIRVRVIDPITV